MSRGQNIYKKNSCSPNLGTFTVRAVNTISTNRMKHKCWDVKSTQTIWTFSAPEHRKQVDDETSWNQQMEQKSWQKHPDGFLLLGLVDVGAAFPQVEVHLVSGVAALQLQQSRVLALVPQAALVAGEDGLTPQSGTENTKTHSQTTCTTPTVTTTTWWDLLTFQASSIFSRSVHLHTHRQTLAAFSMTVFFMSPKYNLQVYIKYYEHNKPILIKSRRLRLCFLMTCHDKVLAWDL